MKTCHDFIVLFGKFVLVDFYGFDELALDLFMLKSDAGNINCSMGCVGGMNFLAFVLADGGVFFAVFVELEGHDFMEAIFGFLLSHN